MSFSLSGIKPDYHKNRIPVFAFLYEYILFFSAEDAY